MRRIIEYVCVYNLPAQRVPDGPGGKEEGLGLPLNLKGVSECMKLFRCTNIVLSCYFPNSKIKLHSRLFLLIFHSFHTK